MIDTRRKATQRASADPRALMRRFVQAYWLRPENALWMTLRSLALSRIELARPSIDVSCGDGVFAFLYGGGRFDPDFDVFTSVAHLDGVQSSDADMFDAVSPDYAPPIVAAPVHRIDAGTDVKPSMLAKAKTLHLYERLVEHNNNDPLPFDDGLFETVYCNSAYWIENINGFLAELRRITRPGGRVVLHLKLDAIRECTLNKYERTLGRRFLEILGRGRFDCWPSLCDRATWERRFVRAGLAVVEATPFVTATHSHIWDVGLRPIAPLLVRMGAALSSETRSAIKSDWVELFCDLLEPFCDPDLDLFNRSREPAEVQYVLRPG